MPRQVLFIQGGGEAVHDRWDDKLVASLKGQLGDGYNVAYPHMPDEADPHYAAWKAAILTAFDALDDGAVVVGHSIGASILLHVLAEAPPKATLGGLFLIAPPFIGDGGWPSDEMAPLTGFAPAFPVFLYQGTADDTVPASHPGLYERLLPRVTLRHLTGRDHQLNNDLGDVARDISSLPA